MFTMTNFEALARLLVRTWRDEAVDRARFLGGGHRYAPLLVDLVMTLQEKA